MPSVLLRLARLVELRLNRNSIDRLPKFYHLSQLQILDLRSNHLSVFPDLEGALASEWICAVCHDTTPRGACCRDLYSSCHLLISFYFESVLADEADFIQVPTCKN